MSPDELNELKDLCKNEQCFKKLKKMMVTLMDERDEKSRCLSLLESAISSDYDSILITKLDLEEPGPEIVYVNDGFCEMTGYSKEEVIGKTPRILQGPKTDQEVLEKLKRRLKSGQCFFGQTVNYRKDGSEFINQWDIHPLTDGDGAPTHWVSYQHDITERKRIEKQLMDTKVEFDKLREESHQTLVDIDVEGNIISANHSFCKLLGYDKKELKQQKIWDLISKRHKQNLQKQFEEVDPETEVEGREFKGFVKHKSGIPIQVKGITRQLDLRSQKIIRVEIQNISLRKKVMKALGD